MSLELIECFFSGQSDTTDVTENESIENIADIEIERKRKRNKIKDETKWLRNIRKSSRTSGKEYVSVKGNNVPSKNIDLSDCECIRECHKLVSPDQRKKLFDAFYALEHYNLQTAHLCGLIKICPKINVSIQPSRRSCTRLYHLINEHGLEVPVCKSFFKK